VIFALAERKASSRDGFWLGWSFFAFIPTVGIMGWTGVGIIETGSIGCVFIGPAVGLVLGMLTNSRRLAAPTVIRVGRRFHRSQDCFNQTKAFRLLSLKVPIGGSLF
jgi:hypothetical protein